MPLSSTVYRRSDLLGRPVVVRTSGRRLGIINQVWCVPNRQQVVILGVRKPLMIGPQYSVRLKHIEFSNNVVWAEEEAAICDIDLRDCTTFMQYEIMTEVGELLGKICNFWTTIDSCTNLQYL
jgi:sporulation protein YlmC with PRC-barrel domain